MTALRLSETVSGLAKDRLLWWFCHPASTLVRQHYVEFLSREPDAPGWHSGAIKLRRVEPILSVWRSSALNVSAAFFLSIEFQETGYLVYRIHKAAYGNLSGAPVPLSLSNFLPDTREIANGLVVGQPGWEQVSENNKNAFATAFVTRSKFTTAYPQTMTAENFVDRLNQNAGGVLSQVERDTLVMDVTSSAKTRAQVLRAVAEDSDLAAGELNKAFVLMQYFGYLRRNPNDTADANFNAEMVKAFLVSTEYRQRYGP